jgi:hypothetical protein
MGTLNPGATYIYERSGGIIYARETGKTERTIVGYDPLTVSDGATSVPWHVVSSEWNRIFRAAETNPALQEALDRVKILYNLSKQDGQ